MSIIPAVTTMMISNSKRRSRNLFNMFFGSWTSNSEESKNKSENNIEQKAVKIERDEFFKELLQLLENDNEWYYENSSWCHKSGMQVYVFHNCIKIHSPFELQINFFTDEQCKILVDKFNQIAANKLSNLIRIKK